jgi:hypothetical protein
MSPDPGPSTEIRLDTRALRCHPTPCQHGDAHGVNKLHFVAHPAASLAGVNAFGLPALRALHLQSWASSPHPASKGRSAHTTQNPIDRESHSQIRSIERFNRTMLQEWAYGQLYRSNTERRRAFTSWLRTYNHRRRHTALDGLTPMAVLVNNPGGNHS